MKKVSEAAKAALTGNTGFGLPKVVRVDREDGLYHVIVDVTDSTGIPPVLRTYDVVVDGSGDLYGYMPLASGSGRGPG